MLEKVLPVDLPELIGGKYRPHSVLGSGATGTVYSVEHIVTGELLALKVMKSHLGSSPDAIARFKREARAASKIRSQHVVRIFDADVAPELGGVPFLVMDLLDGGDLEQVSNNLPVNREDVVEWLRQIALALDKAHRIGIIHRDLKPENLFLTRLDDGTPLVKILDFGIARIAAESPGTTQSGQLFGTPLYMAPEQARGNPAEIGPSTDLFALGQIAYRLLTGVPYRAGSNLSELLHEILNEPLQAPSDRGQSLGPDFDAWFLRACHNDPASRFGSAREEVEALARALGMPAEPVDADTTPISSGSRGPTSRDSLTTSQPDSNRRGLTTLRARSVGPTNGATDSAGASVRRSPAPLFEEPSEEPDALLAVAPPKENRRVALLAVSAFILVPVVVMAAYLGGRTPASTVAPHSSACPVDSSVSSVATAAPSAVPSAARTATEPAEPTKAMAAVTHPAVTIREAPRWLPAPPTPPVQANAPAQATPPRATVTRRGSTNDDPLSDQQ
jgi:serine/threonine protein kinase